MPQKYAVDKSFGLWAHFVPPLSRCAIAFARAFLTVCPKGIGGRGVRAEKLKIAGRSALLLSPERAQEGRKSEKALPCLVYFHGGGFVFKAAPYHYRNAAVYAVGAGFKVLLIDYRLAPKDAYHASAEDCFAAYLFAAEQAEKYDIDPARIAVGGDSAGGCLAAETVRRAPPRSRHRTAAPAVLRRPRRASGAVGKKAVQSDCL